MARCGLALALLICATNGQADRVDSVQTQQQLDDVTAKIEALRQAIKTTQRKESDTEKALRTSKTAISSTRKRLREVNSAIEDATQDVDNLNHQRKELLAAKRHQQNAIERDLRAAFRSGQEEYIKLLLNQQDPAKLARIMNYYKYLNRARQQRLQSFNATLTDINDNRLSLDTALARQKLLKTQLEEEAVALQQARTKSQQALAQLKAELSSSNSELNQLNANRNALQDLLKAVEEQLADLPTTLDNQASFKALRGKLPWPAKGKLQYRFGSKPNKNAAALKGIVMKPQANGNVKAVYRGRVVYADWMRGYGMLMIIDHGNGYLTLYGDNDSLLYEPGDWVEADTTVAISGAPARLYFEIREKGRPVNPLKWCKR